MNSTPKYIASPKAARVPMAAEMLPSKPSIGFALTQSVIIQVITEKMTMTIPVDTKYGITDCVFFSSSISRVREAYLAVEMYWKVLSISA